MGDRTDTVVKTTRLHHRAGLLAGEAPLPGRTMVTAVNRQANHEPAAFGLIGFDPDFSAVSFNDMLHNGQAEAGSAQLAGSGFIDAIKTFEDARSIRFRNADPRIRDAQFDGPCGADSSCRAVARPRS